MKHVLRKKAKMSIDAIKHPRMTLTNLTRSSGVKEPSDCAYGPYEALGTK